VVILLHGMYVTKSNMEDIAQDLSTKFRCVALDLPGHNKVSLKKITKFDDLADYVLMFIKKKQFKEVYLVGYSLGGLISLKIAEKADNTKMVKGLVVWSAPILGFQHGLTRVAKLAIPISKIIPEKVYLAVVTNDILNKLIASVYSKADLFIKPMKGTLSALSLRDAVKLIDISVNVSFDFPKSVPTLFVFDKRDPLVSYKNYRHSKEHFESGSLIVATIHKSGHFRDYEGYSSLRKEIQRFLTENL